MADWYVSSAAYAAIAAFVPSTAYTVGQIVKPSAPTANNRHAFRCTTAGTASTEPTWTSAGQAADGQTYTTGGATFTCVTGRSTYFWASAGGDLGTLTGDGSAVRVVLGDRVFISSDHSESNASKSYFLNLSSAWTSVTTLFISVNRAGSTPPVAADVTSGATFISTSATITLEAVVPVYLEGWRLQSASHLIFNSSGTFPIYLKNCALWLNNATAGSRIYAANPAKVGWDNTTVQFGAVGQGISSNYVFDLTWINTPSAIQGATIPTTLFVGANAMPELLTCRGLDISAETGTLLSYGLFGTKLLVDSCKIASGATRYGGAVAAPNDVIELINCYDGTHILNERYVAAGSVVTERTITLTGGAADDVGAFSHKMVSSSAHIDKWTLPLEGFWFDVENQSVGVSHTATVEIVSSGSLNNDDISLLLEYQGTAGSSVASFATSLPATPLTANAAVTTSTAAWNSVPATPVYQHLQLTFTPQVVGRVRGQVRLGKASTTVYVNPQVTIT